MVHDFGLRCRHCDAETLEPVEATVTGCIPEYAYGDYLFNGGGIGKFGDAEYQHTFDLGAVLQKVSVSSSGSSYMSRYLQTSTLARNQKAGTIVVPEFGTKAVDLNGNSGFLGKVAKMANYSKHMSDNAPVSILAHNDKVYAIGDMSVWFELDVQNLSVKRKNTDLDKAGLVTCCPHFKRASNGNVVSVGQSITAVGPKYNVVEFPADGGLPTVLARASPRWKLSASLLHDFGITQNYLVFLEQPLYVRFVEVIKAVLKCSCFVDTFKWCPEENTSLTLIDQRSWQPITQKFTFEPMFIVHFVNSYETEGGDLVIDLECFESPELIMDSYISNLREPKDRQALHVHFSINLKRIIVPLSQASHSSEIHLEAKMLTELGFGNPKVNPNYEGREYTYAYGVAHTEHDHGRLTKLDVRTGEVVHFTEPGLYPAELMYIPNPHEKAEDDGVVVSFCLSSRDARLGTLLFLSAADMKLLARVEFTAAGSVTWTSHGTFIPES
ncbi:carotenoid isomerooxygenase [Hyalella azteca]|uniref:Carotenoid isomerooxygenase n=1 Tax=Hyalella azteca TaxID=294128 RepID=A0A8B7N124_HYAAZ|nr:carotenoid isomerooxygenase [Hyalella azteca]